LILFMILSYQCLPVIPPTRSPGGRKSDKSNLRRYA
jgi:hypothetical protein